MQVTLRPLPYHVAVADLLARENPSTMASLRGAPTGGSDLDQSLLRSTYRLDPASHPAAYDALAGAAGRLGVTVPGEIYVAEGGGAQAELLYVPDRTIVLLGGALLDLLDPVELRAVLGHELAHHVLWGAEGGRYLAASRLLEAGEVDARTAGEYLETARRYRLATELYCDRGAALACGAVEPAVAGLLKVSTGLRQVDPAAYLRQAAEVDLSSASAGVTHPENVLRAWALHRWHGVGESLLPEVEAQVEAAVGPALDLGALDVLGQDALLAVTRELVRQALMLTALRAPEVLELAERYGVTPPAGPSPATEIATGELGALPEETRRFLCAVLTDLATADPDGSHAALAAAVAVASCQGLREELVRFLERELALDARERTAVLAGARELLEVGA